MDKKGGTPKLVCGNHAMPVFYRDVMYREDTEEKDEDSIQLWRRTAKTEYPDPPDTGYLSFCGQLSDGDLCPDMR